MGWLFKCGCTRRDMIRERVENWERTTEDGVSVKSTCLAHCYRGGAFSGVLWSVWERTFSKDGHQTQATERWITCDLLRHQRDYGWGYKDMEESMFPFYYSCPLSYLDLVPIEQYGGHAQWREQVGAHHARAAEKRRTRKAAGHR